MLETREMAVRVGASMSCQSYPGSFTSPQIKRSHIVLAGVDGFCIKPFSSFLFGFHQVLTYPDVAIESENQIHTTRQRNEVRLQSTH